MLVLGSRVRIPVARSLLCSDVTTPWIEERYARGNGNPVWMRNGRMKVYDVGVEYCVFERYNICCSDRVLT